MGQELSANADCDESLHEPYSDSNYGNDGNDEIILFELALGLALWRKKTVILIIVLSSLVASIVFTLIFNTITYRTTLRFSLSFPGIEKHENPDGSPFHPQQIISPSILSGIQPLRTAMNKGKHPEITISEMIPESVTKKRGEKSSEVFFPDRFSLSISTDKRFFLSESERAEIVISIIKMYKERIVSSFASKLSYSESFPDDFLETNDYSEIIDVFALRINNALMFLNTKFDSNDPFHSLNQELLFSDLKMRFELLNAFDLKNINDFIENKRLTKNRKILSIVLKQDILKLDDDQRLNMAESKASEGLLEKVLTISILDAETIPLTDRHLDSSTIDKVREKNLNLFLVKKTVEAATKASENEIEKKQKMDMLNGIERLSNEDQAKYFERADSLLEEIQSHYISYIIELNAMNKRFLEIKHADSVKIYQSPKSKRISSLSMKHTIPAFVVVSLLISICGILFINTIKNPDQNNK